MSLYGALRTGVSGLTVQSQALAVSSDNIANVKTAGYKTSNSSFATLVTNQSSPTNYSSGGLTGRVMREIDAQGILENSKFATDISISGDGFFAVTNNVNLNEDTNQWEPTGSIFYTRAGQFRVNKDGNMINSAGMYLLGWTRNAENTGFDVSNVSTDFRGINVANQSALPSATNLVKFSANINGNASSTDDKFSTSAQIIDKLGIQHTLSLEFRNVGTKGEWDLFGSIDGGSTLLNPDADNDGAIKIDTDGGAADGVISANELKAITGSATPATTYDLKGTGTDTFVKLGKVIFNATDGSLKSVTSTREGSVDADREINLDKVTTVNQGDIFKITIAVPGETAIDFSHTAVAGDTTASVVAALNTAINGNANFTSSVDGTSINVTAGAGKATITPTVTDRNADRKINLKGVAVNNGDVFTVKIAVPGAATAKNFSYTANATDNITSVRTKLNTAINNDADFTSSLDGDGTSINVTEGAGTATITPTVTDESADRKIDLSGVTTVNQGDIFKITIAEPDGTTTDFSHTALATDNTASVVAALNTAINGNANFTSSVDGTSINVTAGAGTATITPTVTDRNADRKINLSGVTVTAGVEYKVTIAVPGGTTTDFSHTASGTDTTASVLAALNTKINGNANFTSSVDGNSINVTEGAGTATITPTPNTIPITVTPTPNTIPITVTPTPNTIPITVTPTPDKVTIINTADAESDLGIIPTTSKKGLMQLLISHDGNVADGVAPATPADDVVAVTLDFGLIGGSNGLTGTSNKSVLNNIEQNGQLFGSLAGVSINNDGEVIALFDNEQTRALYQIPVTTFNNPNGLEPLSGNVFRQTFASGLPLANASNQGGVGQIIPQSVETSTVDLANEFTAMIMTQRAYSAATRIITTSDDMLAELMQIKR